MTSAEAVALPSSEDVDVPGPAPAAPKQSSGRRALTPYLFLSPTLVLLIGLMAVPIAMVIAYSFMKRAITNPDTSFVGLDNYLAVIQDPSFTVSLVNTLIFCAVSVVAHFVIGLAFALLLNSDLVPVGLRVAFRAILILPWLFTVAVTAVLWRMLLSPNGVINYLATNAGVVGAPIEWLSSADLALPAITFINIWCGYPFFMISLLAGLQGIPQDLYEAAKVDGAGPVAQFVSVTLPQLRPVIISMALLDFIWTSQQFALIWMTTGGGPINATEVLSTFTYKLAFASYDFAEASASAVIVLLLSTILAVLYVRHQRAKE
ncbi:carbohydrate ABC transporter permease [Naumannella halotolerans]|uniref:Multiple sugar transport system permease protein n=1 Tax=Naumannella halotolerans TaxID=993414 RepID=A0A4V3ENU1_9ACTN|nr:sugar ABC transporter permease [Naumannella halotolerans]TDT33888.1 multiple sugar transport system permease protein [Naumannella halotolerans]